MSFLLTSDFMPPATLTGVIRTALFDLQTNQFTLSRWLPNVDIDDIAYEFTQGGQGLAEAAVYRAFDAESRIGRRETIGKVMGELPPISEKMVLNEYDRLKLRKLEDDSLLPFIARDAVRLARNIGGRLELARGDALFNAGVTINENGVIQTVSFGRLASHSVVAAIPWTTYATATPLDDLEAWVATYVATNGTPPGTILMSRSIYGHMRRTAQMRGQVYPTASSPPNLNSDQARTVIDSMDLPPIELYDAQVKVNGVSTRITPVDKLLLLPAPGSTTATQPTDLGGTLLGTTAESLEPEYGLEGEQPGIVAASYRSTDPIRLWTHAVAIGLPVLKEPNLTFQADVI